MEKFDGKKIWIAGHSGMVGSALARQFQSKRVDLLTPPRRELDLCDPAAVRQWLERNRPDFIFCAAAKVGGIHANNVYRADFIYENLMIAANIIHAAQRAETKKLLFLGSSCIYPRDAPQPIKEEALLTGPLEETNRPYAIAKIAGIELCQAYRAQYGCDFITAQPTNLYGPGDNFHPEDSHVMAALLSRFHRAKVENRGEVVVWGTGKPLREFLFVDDLAEACLFLMEHYSDISPINIGSGEEISIADLAALIARQVGFEGEITFNPSRPDGTPRKIVNTSRLTTMGWRAKTSLEKGLAHYYKWFLANQSTIRQ